MLKAIFSGIAIMLLAVVFLTTTYTIEQYEVGVLTTNGALTEVQGPGRHYKAPFFQDITHFRTDIQNLSPRDAINTYTFDNQEVDVIFNVFYRVPADKAGFVYANVKDYRERLFNIAVDRIKVEMGKVNVAHVAEKRGQLRDSIRDSIAQGAASLGLEVPDIQLTNLEYTKSYRAAIEQAAASKANIEQREYELQQERKNAEKAQTVAKGVADAAIESARGKAVATLTNAEAEAKAIRLTGEATASAIKAQTEALGQNPRLVELRKAEKWDGQLPKSMLSNVMPFMNVDQLK